MAALAPQQRQCELGSYYPAGTLVKPPLRQAAGTLAASVGTVRKNSVRLIFAKTRGKTLAKP